MRPRLFRALGHVPHYEALLRHPCMAALDRNGQANLRSCGAPFSGMNMDTNWSKSASATTHPPRTARAGCGVIQLTTNWHAFPVQPPLSDTEIEKKHHRYTVFGSIFTFSHKIRGTNPNTRYAKKKQGMMGVGKSNFFNYYVFIKNSDLW